MRRFFILLIIAPLFLHAQKNDTTSLWQKDQEKRLEELRQKLGTIEETFDRERKISDKTFNSVSNQLSASSNSLTLFGILFGILAVAVGIYVTYIERKIVRISEKNSQLLNQTQTVKNEVVEINRQIQNDIGGLFKKIKREETNHILDRLMKVPKDISNLLQELLSRDLEKADFDRLKISYQKLLPIESHYTEKYKMLFFQHFPELALNDVTIKEEFLRYIPSGIDCSFENDILKSTNDIFQYFIDTGLVNSKRPLNIYFEGLNKSQFKEFKPLYELIFQKLSQRDKQFLLAQLIDSSIETQESKIYYGDFLIDAYGSKELAASEKLVIEELISLKNQKKHVEEKGKTE